MATESDLLEPSRPVARWVKLVAVAAVLAICVAGYLDRQVAHREAAALSACDRTLEAASRVYDARMTATYDYIRPSIRGTAHHQAQVLSLMAVPARQALPAARKSRARCAGIRVLAWHAGNVSRRDAAQAYASGLVRRLQVVASGQQTFDVADRHLAELRKAAGIRPTLDFM